MPAAGEFAQRAAHLRVPVLMLTASDISATRLRRAGCPFVSKPFHVELLLQETRRLLREHEAHRAKTVQLLDRPLENKAELAGSIAAMSAAAANGRAAVSASRPPTMWRSFELNAVSAPGSGRIIQAPPVITVLADANHYLCGNCGTLMMIAESEHLHGIVVHCRACNTHNQGQSRSALRAPSFVLRISQIIVR